jgi:Flp pilus assembly protein TadG
MSIIRRSVDRRLGQSMVEFALLAPAFFLMMMGVLDFGRAGFYYVNIADLTKQTARYAAAYNTGTGFSCCGSTSQVYTYIKGQANATTINTVTYVDSTLCARPAGQPTLACQLPGLGQANYWVVKCVSPTCNPETITVTVVYAFRPTTPMVSSITGTMYLWSDATMIKEYIG